MEIDLVSAATNDDMGQELPVSVPSTQAEDMTAMHVDHDGDSEDEDVFSDGEEEPQTEQDNTWLARLKSGI